MYRGRVKTEELLDAIDREQSRMLRAIDALGSSVDSVPITQEGWTAKDVLAHLIHYAGQIAFALGAQIKPPTYVLTAQGQPTGEEWNALAVAHYRETPVRDVRSEFERIMSALVERARVRTDDDMLATDSVPWAVKRPLWQFIAGDTFLHFAEHAKAIERAHAQS